MAGVAPSQTNHQSDLHPKYWLGRWSAYAKPPDTGNSHTPDPRGPQPGRVREDLSPASLTGLPHSAERYGRAAYHGGLERPEWQAFESTGFGSSRQTRTDQYHPVSSPQVRAAMPFTVTDDKVPEPKRPRYTTYTHDAPAAFYPRTDVGAQLIGSPWQHAMPQQPPSFREPMRGSVGPLYNEKDMKAGQMEEAKVQARRPPYFEASRMLSKQAAPPGGLQDVPLDAFDDWDGLFPSSPPVQSRSGKGNGEPWSPELFKTKGESTIPVPAQGAMPAGKAYAVPVCTPPRVQAVSSGGGLPTPSAVESRPRGRSRAKARPSPAGPSPAGSSRPEKVQSNPAFQPYEIVWAKCPNFPWWPAQVQPPSSAGLSMKHRPDDIFVVYLHDKTYNWLPARSVEPFLNSYSARAKVKDVQPALAAAWALLGHKLPARNAGEPQPPPGVKPGIPCVPPYEDGAL